MKLITANTNLAYCKNPGGVRIKKIDNTEHTSIMSHLFILPKMTKDVNPVLFEKVNNTSYSAKISWGVFANLFWLSTFLFGLFFFPFSIQIKRWLPKF